jgi:hypothetical protein
MTFFLLLSLVRVSNIYVCKSRSTGRMFDISIKALLQTQEFINAESPGRILLIILNFI